MKINKKFGMLFAGDKHFLYACIAMILTLSIFVFPFNAPAFASMGSDYWSNYIAEPAFDGTAYKIGSAAELAWVAEQVNTAGLTGGKFILTNDIDLSGHYWEPIGTDVPYRFTGSFDGARHTISNLQIGSPNDPDRGFGHVGLFGRVETGTIQNVKLENVGIYSVVSRDAGGLFGMSDSIVQIYNCSVTGNIDLSLGNEYGGSIAGGLIGSMGEGLVENCRAACDVRVGHSGTAGGLVGSGGNFTNCSASGNVWCGDATTGNACAGGLAGMGGEFENCYATGNVTCGSSKNPEGDMQGMAASAGGLIGAARGSVLNCYATGAVTASDGGISGGLFGTGEGVIVYNTYWNSDTKTGIGRLTVVEDAGPFSAGPSIPNDDQSKPLAASYMKSAEFTALLNDYAKIDSSLAEWLNPSGGNNGYPELDLSAAFNNVSSITALPSSSNVLISGKTVSFEAFNKTVSFEAYNINGSNYFKLRDLAAALNGSEKQFNIKWDDVANAISLVGPLPYDFVGGELAVSGSTASVNATLTSSTTFTYGDGLLRYKPYGRRFKAYNINGSNYFKLRDIAAAMNFNVTFDAATNTIKINTSAGYEK